MINLKYFALIIILFPNVSFGQVVKSDSNTIFIVDPNYLSAGEKMSIYNAISKVVSEKSILENASSEYMRAKFNSHKSNKKDYALAYNINKFKDKELYKYFKNKVKIQDGLTAVLISSQDEIIYQPKTYSFPILPKNPNSTSTESTQFIDLSYNKAGKINTQDFINSNNISDFISDTSNLK
jgi:hypothetical protein